MQQRAQIARCLAQQPEVLMMDEPFGALDALTRERACRTRWPGCARGGPDGPVRDHDLEEAIYLGDRVVALRANPGRAGRAWRG